MSTINDGGPAFPCGGGDFSGLRAWPGMTLRDYFAGLAMQALLSDHDIYNRPSSVAKKAWEMADVMIKLREGKSL